ncbi:MAG: class I SAM-dependent methyltransferase [Planctomycetota bacterium]
MTTTDSEPSGKAEAGATKGQRLDIESCQLCGQTEFTEMFRDEPYSVRICKDCGFVYVTPRLDDEALKEVYGATYWESDKPREQGYANYAADADLYLKTFRRRARLVERFLPGYGNRSARILDVGCAAGFFLQVMHERGHDVRGCELSAAIARHAVEVLGEERVHVGFLHEVAGTERFPKGHFDLVTMWDVLEHVPDPQALLHEVKEMLAPGGHLLLETQNVQSRFAKFVGKKWHHFKHEEHIYHFDPKTIRKILDDCGYEVVHQGPRFGGKFVSLGFIAERAGRLHPALSTLLKPLELVRRANVYLNFRDEMIVVARPKNTAGPS